MTSLALVFTDNEPKTQPTNDSPNKVKKLMHKRVTRSIFTSKNAINTGIKKTSAITRNIKLDKDLAMKRASLVIGVNKVPANPSVSFSREEARLNPRIAPNVSETHNIPGTTRAIIRGVGSNAKLKVTIDSSENTSIDNTISFDLTSYNKSFLTTVNIYPK
jgi:hypothetical protein